MITISWKQSHLTTAAGDWWLKKRRQQQAAREHSPWWDFAYDCKTQLTTWTQALIDGAYRFSPLSVYRFKTEIVTTWTHRDQLMQHLLYRLIKPTFKHYISKSCLHLQGPSAVKTATRQIRAALAHKEFGYIIRGDIKGYYASIQHDILCQQVDNHFNDPRLLQYLHDIITIGVEDGGNITLPTQGIPIRGSLSLFFAAVYLTPLDRAFENAKGIFYLRYNDDFILLIKTKRQYRKARKRLFQILEGLKLRLAPHKSTMGRLDQKPFHFLGVQHSVSRNTLGKIHVATDLHPRSSRRALDRVQVMQTDAVHPALRQLYLRQWATWWSRTLGVTHSVWHCLMSWIWYTACRQCPRLVPLGTGLLPWSWVYSRSE